MQGVLILTKSIDWLIFLIVIFKPAKIACFYFLRIHCIPWIRN